MKERISYFIAKGQLYGFKPVTKEEYMKNYQNRCLWVMGEAFGCESDKPYTPYAFWGETWIPKEDISPYILRTGEGEGVEVDTNETPKEEAKINLGDNIDETKLVLGDTPFLDKYIPIAWMEERIRVNKNFPCPISFKGYDAVYQSVIDSWENFGRDDWYKDVHDKIC